MINAEPEVFVPVFSYEDIVDDQQVKVDFYAPKRGPDTHKMRKRRVRVYTTDDVDESILVTAAPFEGRCGIRKLSDE